MSSNNSSLFVGNDLNSKVPCASILILTKNGEKTINQCLSGVFKQSFRDFEVVLVDSGSTDKTIEIASHYPIRLHRIVENDFHHGRTRNFAVSLAKGKYVIFLVQDAFPYNERWLEELISPFGNEKIAATFSRQEPRKDTNPLEASFIKFTYPDVGKSIITKEKKNSGDPGDVVQLSDVSSAYRKELAVFDSTINTSEDQMIAKSLLDAGHYIAYVPHSVVCHSHSYNLPSLFKRYYNMGRPSGRFIERGFGFSYSIAYSLKLFSSSFSFILSKKDLKWRIIWLAYSIAYNSLKIFAYILGYLRFKLIGN
jgi:rhamnosyltransferase